MQHLQRWSLPGPNGSCRWSKPRTLCLKQHQQQQQPTRACLAPAAWLCLGLQALHQRSRQLLTSTPALMVQQGLRRASSRQTPTSRLLLRLCQLMIIPEPRCGPRSAVTVLWPHHVHLKDCALSPSLITLCASVASSWALSHWCVQAAIKPAEAEPEAAPGGGAAPSEPQEPAQAAAAEGSPSRTASPQARPAQLGPPSIVRRLGLGSLMGFARGTPPLSNKCEAEAVRVLAGLHLHRKQLCWWNGSMLCREVC